MAERFEAIIIGSGLGGLSSAITLAQKGIKTLLLEKHNVPGGCSTSFKRGRFEFETSLHEFCAYGTRDNLGYAGRLVEDIYDVHPDIRPCPELFRAIFTSRSGKVIDIVLPLGEKALIETMEHRFPGSKEAMERFLSLAKECLEVSSYFDAHMFDKKKRNGKVKISSSYFISHHFTYLQIAEEPFNEVCRKIGLSEDVIDVLDCYSVYLGVDPEEISFAHLGTMIGSYIFYGPTIIAPNSHAFSLALLSKFHELGGTSYFGVEAKEVVASKDGTILGVDTDKGFFACEEVIANVYPSFAYHNLLSKYVKVSKRIRKLTYAASVSSRFVNIYIGLNEDLKDLGINEYTLFMPGNLRKTHRQSEDPTDYLLCAVTAYNAAIPEVSPEGTSILTFTLEFKDDVWGKVKPEDYFRLKEEIAKKAITEYETTRGVKISDCIEEIEIATPWTFARYLGNPEGGAYGVSMNSWNTILTSLMDIRKDQPIPGFKTTGASGARGDGYSQSLWTGRDIGLLAYEEILEKRKKHG